MALRFAIFLLIVCLSAPARLGAAWIDVPYVEQRENGCGAAATAMVLQYWSAQGFGVTPQAADAAAIYASLYSADAQGIFGSRIEQYFRTQGFQPYVFAGRWDDLAWHVARARPLIVCVRSGGSSAPLHYLVVAGLDNEKGVVLVNDSARRKLSRIDRATFEREWKAAGNWTLLALPQQR